jgi:hypothetical protein
MQLMHDFTRQLENYTNEDVLKVARQEWIQNINQVLPMVNNVTCQR